MPQLDNVQKVREFGALILKLDVLYHIPPVNAQRYIKKKEFRSQRLWDFKKTMSTWCNRISRHINSRDSTSTHKTCTGSKQTKNQYWDGNVQTIFQPLSRSYLQSIHLRKDKNLFSPMECSKSGNAQKYLANPIKNPCFLLTFMVWFAVFVVVYLFVF